MRKTEAATPEQIETEQALLGSFMLEKESLDLLETDISREDFSRPTHQVIYDAIREAYKLSDKVDLITVRNAIPDKDKWKGYGEYLMACVERIPTSYNAPVYAKIVRDGSRIRKYFASLVKAQSMMNDPEMTPEMVQEYLNNEAAGVLNNEVSMKTAAELADGHYAFLAERANRDSSKLFSSGFPTFDNQYMRLGDCNVIVIKAERGSGKTHIAIHLTMQCANYSTQDTVVYSLEMNRHQIMNRFIAYIANKNAHILQKPLPDDWDWIVNAQGEFSSKNVLICDDADVSIDRMYRDCKKLKAKGRDIGMIVIDFAEQIAPSKSRKNENREQELSSNSRGLRKIANDFDCTIVLLSQVNNEGKERGSQGIGNLADHLITWKCEKNSNEGLLMSDKNRFGTAMFINIGIDKGTSRMWEIDKTQEDEQ